MSHARQSDGSASSDISTPCIGVCTLDPDDRCVGCLRTSGEILNWLQYTESQRREIMDSLPARLDALFS